MNGTRGLTALADGLLSVGRVQTPTLAMVVDREDAIDAFVSEPYWEVLGQFRDGDTAPFKARWGAPGPHGLRAGAPRGDGCASALRRGRVHARRGGGGRAHAATAGAPLPCSSTSRRCSARPTVATGSARSAPSTSRRRSTSATSSLPTPVRIHATSTRTSSRHSTRPSRRWGPCPRSRPFAKALRDTPPRRSPRVFDDKKVGRSPRDHPHAPARLPRRPRPRRGAGVGARRAALPRGVSARRGVSADHRGAARGRRRRRARRGPRGARPREAHRRRARRSPEVSRRRAAAPRPLRGPWPTVPRAGLAGGRGGSTSTPPRSAPRSRSRCCARGSASTHASRWSRSARNLRGGYNDASILAGDGGRGAHARRRVPARRDEGPRARHPPPPARPRSRPWSSARTSPATRRPSARPPRVRPSSTRCPWRPCAPPSSPAGGRPASRPSPAAPRPARRSCATSTPSCATWCATFAAAP
jgi:hypothetical protein